MKSIWGSGFGDSGYFWISYEEPTLSQGTVFVGSETNQYDKNYGYDDLGWCMSATLETSVTSWMANCFSSTSDGETLKAVSFYTTSPNSTYEIYIYTELTDQSNPTSGSLLYSTKETWVDYAGYHTVEIPGVALQKGSRFSVVMRLNTPGYPYPLAIETPIPGYSETATSRKGESFFSVNGRDWVDGKDVGTSKQHGSILWVPEDFANIDLQNAIPLEPLADNETYLEVNACIRAFTTVSGTPEPSVNAFSENPGTWHYVLAGDTASKQVLVRIYGRVVSNSIPTNISVGVDGLSGKIGGSEPVSAWLGDSHNNKYEDVEVVTTESYSSRGLTGDRFVIIEGWAPSEEAANASVRHISYTLDGVPRTQDFRSNPIRVGDMQNGPPTLASTGGGGCNAGVGGLALVGVLLFFRVARKEKHQSGS